MCGHTLNRQHTLYGHVRLPMYFTCSLANQIDKLPFCLSTLSLSMFLSLDNPSQVGSVVVTIKVLDVNDNAPEFPRFYEAFICENAKAGQVRKTLDIQR